MAAALRCVLTVALLLFAPPSRGQIRSPVEMHGAVVSSGFPSGTAVSPDGKHLYLTFSSFDAVAVYARDAVTGALSLVEAHRDGLDGVTGLDGPASLVVSLDGANVYLLGASSQSLVVASRDAGTGALTFDAVLTAGEPALGSLGPPRFLAVSPDGANVYAGDASQVATFARNAGTGALTLLDVQSAGTDFPDNTSALIASSDGAHVYAVGRLSIRAFSRDAGTGLLTSIQDVVVDTSGTTDSAALSPDGAHLYLERDPTFGPNVVRLYERDAGTGLLTFISETPFTGRFIMSPDGVHLYANTFPAGGAQIYERDAGTGALSALTTVPGVQNARLLSPDGLHLYAYVGTSFAPGMINVYDRDAGTGGLTLASTEAMGLIGGNPALEGASGVHPTADGLHVYVGAKSAIVAFSRDAGTGELTIVDEEIEGMGGVTGLGLVSGIEVSPDGEHLYAIGETANSLVVFDRDAITGELTWIETHVDGVGGLTGFDPVDLAVSGDGAHVYVVADPDGDGATFLFTRDQVTGSLTFVEASGDGGYEIALSVDDAFILVPSNPPPCGLHVFTRAPGPGTLTPFPFGCTFDNYVLSTIAVSPDGRHAYAGPGALRTIRMSDFRQANEIDAGGFSMYVTPDGAFVLSGGDILGRNPSSGALRVLPEEQPGRFGRSSPDRRHLYSAGVHAVFVQELTPCGPFVSKSKVVLTKTGLDPNPTDDRLVLKADFIMSSDFSSLDPITTGAELNVEDSAGATIVDAVLPGGAYTGSGTRGWKPNGAGTVWKYVDKTGLPIAGIGRAILKDQSQKAAKLVAVRIKGKDAAYPVDTANLPLDLSVRIGTPDQCGFSGFAAADCVAKGSTKVLCRAN